MFRNFYTASLLRLPVNALAESYLKLCKMGWRKQKDVYHNMFKYVHL